MATDGDEALRSFREHLDGSFTFWGDALFELCDAVLCGVAPFPRSPCSASSQSSPAAAATRHSARAGSTRTDRAGSLSPTSQSLGRRS